MLPTYNYKDGYDVDDFEKYEQSGCNPYNDLIENHEDWKSEEKYYWKTKDGKYIKVDDLKEQHIENIVYLFGKQQLEKNGYHNIVEKFKEMRG